MLGLLLIFILYISSVYIGWLPIPKFATNVISKNIGLNEKETEDLNKIVNVYQIVKKSNPHEIKEIEKIILNGGTQEDLINYTVENYDNISEKTFNKIGKQFEMDSIDIKTGKKILDQIVKDYNSKNFSKIDTKLDTLKQLKQKYNLDYDVILKFLSQ